MTTDGVPVSRGHVIARWIALEDECTAGSRMRGNGSFDWYRPASKGLCGAQLDGTTKA